MSARPFHGSTLDELARMGSDPWGDTLGLHFAICDVLHIEGEDIPASWDFGPGWVFRSVEDLLDEGEPYDAQEVARLWLAGHVDADDLRHAGNVLARYAAWLRRAGMDY